MKEERRIRHVSARLPEALAAQVDLVRARLELRHYSDALAHVLDRGLDAIAEERRRPRRLEAVLARIDELVVTLVAIQNVVHVLDPATVERTRERVLEAYRRKRGPRQPAPPDAEGLGLAPGGEDDS
jgi:hypothetical protein